MLNDVRYAVRALGKRPGVTLAAAISLALGMGAVAVIFSWVRGVLLEPLPGVSRQRELFAVVGQSSGGGPVSFSYPDYVDLRDGARTLDALIANNVAAFSLGATNGRPAEQIFGSFVSGNYFEALGVHAALGRTFTHAETAAPNGPLVAVISHRLWQRRFGGASPVIGRPIVLNNKTFEIVGVTPEQFWGTSIGTDLEVFLPVVTQPVVNAPSNVLTVRATRGLQLHARLKPGVAPEQAAAELDGVLARLASTYPDLYKNRRARVLPLWRVPWGAAGLLRGTLLVLAAAVGLVLLLTAANVANLLVARALDRRREMAVRLSLGASRSRLVRQLLIESILLGLLGGIGATIVASWSGRLFLLLTPPTSFPVRFNVQLDTTVVLFVASIAVVTGILSGLAFALHGSRADTAGVLKEESTTLSGGSASSVRLRRALVIVEVAIAMLVLSAATLAVRGILRARHIDPGFQAEGVLLVGYDLRTAAYAPERGRLFHRQVLDRMRALPGVQAASAARSVPLGLDGVASTLVTVDGYTSGPSEDRTVRMNHVSPGYLQTLRIPLRRGRDFALEDDEQAPAVAIVNETMAARYWAGREAVGAQFRAGEEVLTIVGVAGDTKVQSVSEEARPFFYRPLLQQYRPDAVLHVRTAGDPLALAGAVREELRATEPNLPVLRLMPLRTYVQTSLFPQMMAATLLIGLAALSLALVIVGLCSVIAYAVTQRRQEMAIRLAFGARSLDVVGLIVRDAAVTVAIGLVLGLAAALWLAHYAEPLLLGMSAFDPVTFAVAPLVLVVVALSAALVPAWRARRVDPIVALRHQ